MSVRAIPIEVLIRIELRLTLDASRSASFFSALGSNVQICTGKAKHILPHKITGFTHSILRQTAATAAILDAGNIIADSLQSIESKSLSDRETSAHVPGPFLTSLFLDICLRLYTMQRPFLGHRNGGSALCDACIYSAYQSKLWVGLACKSTPAEIHSESGSERRATELFHSDKLLSSRSSAPLVYFAMNMSAGSFKPKPTCTRIRIRGQLADSIRRRPNSIHTSRLRVRARAQGYTAGRCGVRLGTRAAPPMARSLERRPEGRGSDRKQREHTGACGQGGLQVERKQNPRA
ncbi:hypothetical protein B0H13DRAFT_2560555 [Mycena leptocephala]|nr:hypothetical protein B0H13DRAFT_2560555 [Mycena leptocephala]